MVWLPKAHVVVPVDFSDESFAAIDTALDLVKAPESVHVVHVLPELSATEPGVVWGEVDDASRMDHAEDALRAQLKSESDTYNQIDVAVAIGDPGHEIADYASNVGADIIVLPCHGRTGLKRLLIGSVAERVVRLAHCPVLVLKD